MLKHSKISPCPMLDTVKVHFTDAIDWQQYPFCLPFIKNLTDIHFTTPVTFFVGENGTGKSTVLETIALKAGFGIEGGSKNIHFATTQAEVYLGTQQLAEHLTLSWRYYKPQNGYFFRAESFFNVANYLDQIAYTGGGGPERTFAPYGGKSLHAQSHGESFLSVFQHRLGDGGFFIFDEPEAALSPQRQLALLSIMHQLCKNNVAQFIIATHSPIILAYPGATIYSCDSGMLHRITYRDTDHYQITKRFLDDPGAYFRYLFED